ncbi:sulfotransferase family protein [Martelella mangrovi]|uniref:Sulfotransferase n=1 Tax=Martelella mangrovi TaxID=1397477 RepID=A0ABV2I6K8_9HYPH
MSKLIHPLFDRYISHPGEILKNFRRWKNPEVSNIPVAFVLGPPRSGTTLLNRLLLNHPATRGFPIQTNIFSPRSIYEVERFKHYAEPALVNRALAESRSLAGFFARLHEISFPDMPEEGWYVEKTPQHARYLSYILKHLPNSKIILAVRDGRDTFCSGRSAQNIPQASSVKAHARYFNSCIDPVRKLLGENDRILVVKYEEFTSDAEAGLTRIMNFLDLPVDLKKQLVPSSAEKDWRVSEKAFQRLAQPITPATVGRWRKEMTGSEIAEYNSIAGKNLLVFDYPLS